MARLDGCSQTAAVPMAGRGISGSRRTLRAGSASDSPTVQWGSYRRPAPAGGDGSHTWCQTLSHEQTFGKARVWEGLKTLGGIVAACLSWPSTGSCPHLVYPNEALLPDANSCGHLCHCTLVHISSTLKEFHATQFIGYFSLLILWCTTSP